MEDTISYRGFKVQIDCIDDTNVHCLSFCDDECSVEFDMFILRDILNVKDIESEKHQLTDEEFNSIVNAVEAHIDNEYEDLMKLAQKYRGDYPYSSEINAELEKRFPQSHYKVNAYYGKSCCGDFVALAADIETAAWNEAVDFAHDSLTHGYYIEIIETQSGNMVKLDPVEYFDNFEGEFPYKPEDLMNNSEFQIGNEVCISTQALYEKYGEKLSECRINIDETEKCTYYDMQNAKGQVCCMDGETVSIEGVDDRFVTFVNEEGESPIHFRLTLEETRTATLLEHHAEKDKIEEKKHKNKTVERD